MSENKENFLTLFLNGKLIPFSMKVSQNRYVQSIGQGSMGLMAIIMIGAVFNLLNTIPFESYQNLLTSTGIGDGLNAIYNACMNFMGLFMVISVARSAAKSFGHEELANENAFLALMGYLILIPLTANEAGDSLINMNYLGSKGTFLAFIVAILTTKINIAVVERKLTIRMPAGVPENVTKNFTAIIPGALTAVLFCVVRIIFMMTPYGNVVDAVYAMLQTPLASITGSLPGFLILVMCANLLWFVGVHGSYTVLAVLFPIWFTYIGDNMAAAAAGQAIPHMWNISMYDFACNGGCGCTLGLVIVMALFAKSKRYKSFSKMVLPLGLFNINEPVVFAMPLMYNFMFIIPFLLVPVLSLSLAYVFIQMGLMPVPTGIIGFSSMPVFIYGVLQGSWKIGVYQLIATAMSALIWYPFFKAADRIAYEEEQAAALNAETE